MTVRRLPVVDEYVEDGVSVVLLGGQVLTLSPLATLVLAFVGDGSVEVDDLAGRLADEVGPPPTGTVREALDPILRDLASRQLVTLDG